MNLEGYWANPTSGFIRENDDLGRFTGRCRAGEWAAGHLRHSGRLIGHDLALCPIGDGNVWVRHSLEFAIPAVILAWSIIPTIWGGRLKLDSAQSIANWVRGTPDENGGIVF